MATILTLHAGGADDRPEPVVRAEKTREAASALSALSQAMQAGDPLKHPCEMLAVCLAGRVHVGRS